MYEKAKNGNFDIKDSIPLYEFLKLNYLPGVKGNIKDKENIIKQLEDNFERDLEYKMTMTGPHRDDFEIFMNDKNIRKIFKKLLHRTSGYGV